MATQKVQDYAVKQGQKLASRHPLQRLDSPSRGASALLHLVGCCSFAYSFHYLIFNPNPINEAWGWHLQFLTCCGLSVAAATYAVGLLSDLTLSPLLFRVKNLLALTSAPLECCISVLYWTIKAVDPRLLQHPDLPALEPLPDVGFHAAPALLLTLDLLFCSPPWTLTAAPALAVSGVIAVAYWVWVEACFAHNGFYPYPLFGQLDTTGRVVLFAGAAAIMAASTLALKAVYNAVNGGKDGGRSGAVKKQL
ncbi:Integral membrane protein [Neofusicoccum parvum]|uniref:Integral membrane protein n=1 Tax=Neofusicoccum parvum TaxID=310453 RepID=A0ACB5S6P7_9PEZI|nr:Integral membrane protein [Neofusicoccum parvum]